MNILITGAKGMLAYALKKELSRHSLIEADLPDYNLTDKQTVQALFINNNIDFVYHLAAYTQVDLCESNKDLAFAVNEKSCEYLAEECAQKNIPLLAISTDYVFGGNGNNPYTESDETTPNSIYGQSKLAGEKAIRRISKRHFIVRTAWLYGPNGKNFAETIFNLAKEKSELKVVADQKGTPTYTIDLAKALVKFLDSSAYGTYHLVNSGNTTWHGFAEKIVPETVKVIPVATEEFPRPAPRPAYSILSTAKFEKEFDYKLPQWDDGVLRYRKDYL